MPPRFRAALWALGAVASFTSMAIAGRQAGASLDTFEIMTYRSLIGLVLVLSVASIAGTRTQIRTDRLGLHLLRNLFHFFGQNLWFYALAAIPLAQVAALEFSYPIWVALAAPFVLGEHLGWRRVAAIALGFAGILMILRPGVIPIDAGTLAALFCAFGFAGTSLATKKLTTDQSVTCILFWLTVMQGVMGLACAGYDGQIRWPGAAEWPWVVMIGIAGLSAHLCLTTALSLAPATFVTPMEFLRMPAIAGAGAIFLAEPIDPATLAGAGVIMAAILLNISSARRARQGNVT